MASSPIAGICSMATRHLLEELAGTYEKQTGQPVTITWAGGVDVVKRIQAREPFDFVSQAADAVKKLGAEGHVDAASQIAVARSGVAVAVPAGAPPPDLSSGDAVRRAILAAPKVGYSSGPSGVHLQKLFQQWGIAATMGARLVQAQPGVPVGTLVGRGEVQLGFQQMSELVGLPGIDIVGSLPPDIQVITEFSAARCTVSSRADAVAAFLAFVNRPESVAVKRRHGLEP